MTGLFSPHVLTTPVGVPVMMPFDWYLLLFPYWLTLRSFFTWGLLPAAILLLVCSIASFTLGRHRPKIAILVVAAALTVQNLLLLIPMFIDAGVPGASHPILTQALLTNPDTTFLAVTIIMIHVVVWVIPLLFAATLMGRPAMRRRLSRSFLVLSTAYLICYLGIFVFGSDESWFMLTPGRPDHLATWLAPVSTTMCTWALAMFVHPLAPIRSTRAILHRLHATIDANGAHLTLNR